MEYKFTNIYRSYVAGYPDMTIEADSRADATDQLERLTAEMADLGLDCVDFHFEEVETKQEPHEH